jgi:lysine-specific demethylase 8
MGLESSLTSSERLSMHGLLVLEQALGPRIFGRLLAPLRDSFRARVQARLSARPSPSPCSVDRRENLSPEEFQREYFQASRPVIFAGAARNWPCVKKWSLDWFEGQYGEQDLLLVDAPGLTTRENEAGYEYLRMRELVRDIRAEAGKYLRFSPLLHDFPSLAADFDIGWLERMRGGSTFARTYYMFMGGDGHRTYLHNDQPCNLFVQVAGEKKWTLFSPGDSALLYPEVANTAYVKSPVNLSGPDEAKHPLFRHARPITAHLHPGDVLYVPPFVWHEVENFGETIAVGYRYSSLSAAARSSLAFLLLRALSTNPPIWKTMSYGKQDTNLIWAHTGGFIKEVLAERALRGSAKARK